MFSLRHICNALIALAIGSVNAAKAEPSSDYGAVGLAFPQFSFVVSSKPTETNKATSSTVYQADIASVFTTEFAYDGVTIGYGFDLGGNKKAKDNGAEPSKFTAYGFSYFGGFWGVDASYIHLTGLHAVSGSGQTGAEITANPESLRNDIRLTSNAANIWLAPYRYNLELNEFFNPAGKPHGHGFAILMIGSYDSVGIATKKPLYLSPSAASYGNDHDFTGGTFYSGSISIGPAVMLEKYGFYLALFFAIGGGEQTGVYQDGDVGHHATGRPQKTLIYAALGYRGKTVFTALDYNQEQPTYTLNTISIGTTRGSLAWTIGRRF